jgi:hypothetical protein
MLRCRPEQSLQVFPETPQGFQFLWSGFDNLLFELKDPAASAFDQNADRFPHLPAGRAQHLQSIRRGYQERDAVVPHDPHIWENDRKP